MSTSITSRAVLRNGIEMPWLGLGVWQMSEGGQIEGAVRSAVDAGYRSFDTAAAYRNEEGLGKAIRECGVRREELFVTTKVWNNDQGYNATLAAFQESRKRIGLDYIDLYLIHWPVKAKYKETWKALEKLYEDGAVRAIGVSNFQIHHLEDIMTDCNIAPFVNQVEYHPLLAQQQLRKFCQEHRIQLEAWSPLMQGRLDEPVLMEIAARYGKSPAQIILRWDLQNLVVTIPKSANPARILENANIFDFSLSSKDMAKLDALDRSHRFGPDPDNFSFNF
ncbi:aldo/keto reductase [Paenibacillus aestuarii]|uniref:Aldo/keto reductase n=1 Tax=Paenibacillus aestuarii TaxID=516965 RepID=A0ABW0KEW9_9BACL|nr:aldo/keto reductase [Paenibacillus aestuarii]